MATTNPITGDRIRTKGQLSEEGRSNFDAIFPRKKKTEELDPAKEELNFQAKKLLESLDRAETMKISRIDLIALNGNDGDHYGAEPGA